MLTKTRNISGRESFWTKNRSKRRWWRNLRRSWTLLEELIPEGRETTARWRPTAPLKWKTWWISESLWAVLRRPPRAWSRLQQLETCDQCQTKPSSSSIKQTEISIPNSTPWWPRKKPRGPLSEWIKNKDRIKLCLNFWQNNTRSTLTLLLFNDAGRIKLYLQLLSWVHPNMRSWARLPGKRREVRFHGVVRRFCLIDVENN